MLPLFFKELYKIRDAVYALLHDIIRIKVNLYLIKNQLLKYIRTQKNH